MAESTELTHAEAQARRLIRMYNSKLSSAIAATRHIVLNAMTSDRDRALLQEALDDLSSLADAGARAEHAVAEIRHGKSPKQVFSDHTEAFVDREGKLRLLLGRIL